MSFRASFLARTMHLGIDEKCVFSQKNTQKCCFLNDIKYLKNYVLPRSIFDRISRFLTLGSTKWGNWLHKW